MKNEENIITKSIREELFMYLSIFVALASYKLELTILMCIFSAKAGMEAISAITCAIIEYKNKK